MDKLDGVSMDIEAANMEKLKSVFPECFAEGELDIDKLLSLCGEYIDNDFEKYKFEMEGKSCVFAPCATPLHRYAAPLPRRKRKF